MYQTQVGERNKENSQLLEIGRPTYQSANQYETDSLSDEDNSKVWGYGKAIIFGGVDGILTSFAIISAGIGGKLDWSIILLVGVSNVIAAAVAMGAGEYLSSKAHRDFVLTEKRREKWEYKNYKEGEIKEMVKLFVQKGMSQPDAQLVVKKMAEYEDFFVDLVVSQQLGQIGDDSELGLIQDGFVMFLSFALFGILPLIPFCLGPFHFFSDEILSIISFISTLLLLFFLGCIKSTFSTSTFWFTSGLESLLLGAVTAIAGFFLAAGIRNIIDSIETS